MTAGAVDAIAAAPRVQLTSSGGAVPIGAAAVATARLLDDVDGPGSAPAPAARRVGA